MVEGAPLFVPAHAKFCPQGHAGGLDLPTKVNRSWSTNLDFFFQGVRECGKPQTQTRTHTHTLVRTIAPKDGPHPHKPNFGLESE